MGEQVVDVQTIHRGCEHRVKVTRTEPELVIALCGHNQDSPLDAKPCEQPLDEFGLGLFEVEGIDNFNLSVTGLLA